MIFNIFIALLFNTISNTISSPIHKSQFSFHRKIRNALNNEVYDEIKPKIIPLDPSDEIGQCMFVKTEEGTYSFVSNGNSNDICGLYVISEADSVIEFEFEQFDVSCANGGLLSVVDGWELNGQFFPGTQDHPIPRDQRYKEFCGSAKPTKSFIMTQNVGLLEFRIPTTNEGFIVNVRFMVNPKPCNAVLQNPQGVYTIQNYGERVNCTVSIIFPESFQIISSDIGPVKIAVEDIIPCWPFSNSKREHGITRKCKERGLEDYVEIRGGDGLDPHLMTIAEDFCGIDSSPRKHRINVACGNTAIRLVSSGTYNNSITLAFQLLLDLDSPSLVCPAMLEALECKLTELTQTLTHTNSVPQLTQLTYY